MSIKMIVSDMDGTLLNDQLEITPYTTSVMQRIQEEGIILVIASGRSHHMMADYYNQLHMSGYMVGVNGLELYSFKNDKLDKFEAISYKKMIDLCETIFDLGFVPMLMYDDKTLVIGENNDQKTLDIYNKLLIEYPGALPNVRIQSLNSVSNDSINKMCMIVNSNEIGKIINQFKALVPDDVHVMQGGNEWVEIMPKNINKAVRIQQIMKIENITSDEIMIFGDSQNDIEMLALTKNSYAMDNANDDVKSYANHVAENHNHDGVAKEIKKMLKFSLL